MEQELHRTIATSHGRIALQESQSSGMNVLLIHGNSSCRRVFKKQFEDTLSDRHHLIAIDLPGHGQSEDAIDASRTYSRPGLADACLELLDKLNVQKAVLVGWSLGGHVAIEMLARSNSVAGLFITGAPPVGESMAEGFRGRPVGGLASKAELSEEEAHQFAKAIMGSDSEPSVQEAIARTDRLFRPTLFAAAGKGEGVNQRLVVGTSNSPLAIVNGADDRIINLDYVDSVEYKNLWCKRCFRIPGATHAPFWQAPDVFNSLLDKFLGDVAKNKSY